jgi:hypothetical protein
VICHDLSVSSTADRLTRRHLNRATLARQLLLDRADVTPLAAIERLCGIQAQDARPPFVGLWARVAGFRAEDLHGLLHKRAAVRATFLRGTLHVLSARDYQAFRPVIQPVLDDAMKVLGSRAKGLDLDSVLSAAAALYERKPRTFNELRPLLLAEFPAVNERALGFAVRNHLPLVMVPTDDKWAFPSIAEFTPARTWLGGSLSEQDDPDELVRRYLAAFGPATAADVQTWSGLKAVKVILERLRPELEVLHGENGRELFDLPDAPRPAADTPVPPRFLPEFDNLVLAHADRTRVIADEYRGHLVTKNLRVKATVLHDGFVCGTWEIVRKKVTATLRITPFAVLSSRVTDELAAEGESLLSFVEPDAGTLSVTFAHPLGPA